MAFLLFTPASALSHPRGVAASKTNPRSAPHRLNCPMLCSHPLQHTRRGCACQEATDRVVPSVQQSENMGTRDYLHSGNPTGFSGCVWMLLSPHLSVMLVGTCLCYLIPLTNTPPPDSDPDFPLRLQSSEHSCTQAPLQRGHHAPCEEHLRTRKCTLSGLPQASTDRMASFYIPWSRASRICPAVPHTHSHLPRVHDAQLSWDAALPSCSEDAMSTTRDADQPAASKTPQVSNLSLHTRNHGLHSGPAQT